MKKNRAIYRHVFAKWWSLKITIGILFFSTGTLQLTAQQNNNTSVIALQNGKYLSIQVCAENIFRIRVSATNQFPETLMERYGIIKTDWPLIAPQTKTESNHTLLSISDFLVDVNTATGEVAIKNSDKTLSRINIYHQSNTGFVKELTASLESYFGKEKQGGGIIGDSNYTGISKEKEQIAASLLPSVIEVDLDGNERFYGGGATSRKNIQHRGEALRMWATYQKTEITMPFLMSSKGWAIFNNTTALNFFDVGRFQKNKLYAHNTNGDVDFYWMMGGSLENCINLYTTITGKPYLLPKWAYGLAFGGNTMENQMDVMNDAVRFREEKIPCDIMWLEVQWMSKHYDFSTSKNWDYKKFPGEPYWEETRPNKYEHPLLFISKLNGLGFKSALWLCIDHDLSIEEEDLVAQKTGKPLSGLEHWFPHLTKFIDQGIDGFKLDPGRTLDEHYDRKYFNGYTDKEMHNLNQVLLPKQMYTTFREHKGIRSFHHYCGGYAGTQHWGASTSGDNGGGKDALFDQLNLGLSGFVNTSADVLEVNENLKGAMHLGFFLPWVQVNSWYALHHPWYMPQAEKETFRFYAQLRNQLSPYIYSAAIEGSQTGKPILRAMPLMFPDDRKVDNMIYQYMFGENLLVGVFSDSVYLPKGNWINYWTNEKVAGEKSVHAKIPGNRGGALFIKEGAIIPQQQLMQYIGEKANDTLVVKIYPSTNSQYTLWEDDGFSFEYEKGNITKTLFACSKKNESTSVVIEPVKGAYKGMMQKRVYQLEIAFDKKPKQIKVNGGLSNRWTAAKNGTIRLFVTQKIDTEKLIISIY